MKESIISFETAKLAKEKGFPHRDSITHKAYNVNGELGNIFKFDKPYTILAPTQVLLQKWLREIHKIHIVINPYQNEFLDYTLSVLTQHERAMGGGDLKRKDLT